MRRREFIAGLGSAAASPLAARAQQLTRMPVVGFVNPARETSAAAAFRAGLDELGYVDGRTVTIEFHWLDGHYEQIPPLMAELVRRHVAVIATPGNATAALAAKAATSTIPIVFGVADDAVALGLVASLARPGGNATGVNFLANEAVPKRLGLLHELMPKVTRIAVLVNPSNRPASEIQLRAVQDAARQIGLRIDILRATSGSEIEEVFAVLARERTEALFVNGDAYFITRRTQFATLAARYGVATAFGEREYVEAGGLMSYGTELSEMFRQVGIYVGQILKGAKPADLPVVQSTRFTFVINMQTARALRIDVPAQLLATADEVIE